MERVRFITHKGKQVLLLDYHDLSDEAETLAMIEDRKEMVASQPKGSVLTVANVAGARLSKDALMKIKEANVGETEGQKLLTAKKTEACTPENTTPAPKKAAKKKK